MAAQWSEFDPEHAVWVVPPHRMKDGREHRIPLSKCTVELLRKRRGDTSRQPDALVWGLSRAALSKTLALLGRNETVHGFRSAFKDWASERTNFPRCHFRTAPAHISADKVKAACERTTFEQQRRELLDMWSKFCLSPPIDGANNVVPSRA